MKTANGDVKVGLTETDLVSDDAICFSFPGVLNQHYTTLTCVSEMRGQWVQLTVTADTLNFYELDVYAKTKWINHKF